MRKFEITVETMYDNTVNFRIENMQPNSIYVLIPDTFECGLRYVVIMSTETRTSFFRCIPSSTNPIADTNYVFSENIVYKIQGLINASKMGKFTVYAFENLSEEVLQTYEIK